MAEVEENATPVAETPKKGAKKAKGDKKTRVKANHPPTAVMVNGAIKSLKERGGSSLQAIKKYIASTYKVDAEKLAPFIKKFLKSSVASGSLVQTKGKGASGSFKLATSAVSKPAEKSSKPVRKATKRTAPKAVPRTPKKEVKPKVSPKKAAPKPKSPAKAKKALKTPVKKPKAPKAKTAKKSPKGKKVSPKKK